MPKARFLSAVGLVGLLIGVLAQPAMAGVAATTVWFVDDDGLAGANGCNGSQTVPSVIQDAVDAAAPYNTIKVCPGTFVGTVDVATEGLRLTATQAWAAIIKAPTDAGGPVVHLHDASYLYLRWFTILARAAEPCAQPSNLIYVNAAPHARVRANHLGLDGPESFDCRYQHGMTIKDSPDSLVLWNRVTDFASVGIIVETSSGTLVRGNTVSFLHAALPSGVYTDSVGILLYGDFVTARGNLVRALPSAGATTPRLQVGINLFGNGDVARRNIVRYTNYGIQTIITSGVSILENKVRHINANGITLSGAIDGVVAMNTVRANSEGIHVNGASYGSNIYANDFRGASDPDCLDESSGDSTAGTDNWWAGNLGDEDSPEGICAPAP